MKIALLADIHGNHHALEAVLEDIEKRKADQILVLGDIVFKGPLPEKCVETVRGLNTVVLQGNIDELIALNTIQEGFAQSEAHRQALQAEMAWNRARLSQSDLAFLASLPLAHELRLNSRRKLHCVHATPQNLLDIVPPTAEPAEFDRMFQGSDADVVAYAHIHLPFIRFFGGRTVMNTGSVGLPFDGDPRASYAMIEAEEDDCAVSIRRVKYDLDGAISAFANSGHPFADSVIQAYRTGTRPA